MALKALIRKIIAVGPIRASRFLGVFAKRSANYWHGPRNPDSSARGKNRVAELAAGWKEVLATAEIENQSGISERRADCADLESRFPQTAPRTACCMFQWLRGFTGAKWALR